MTLRENANGALQEHLVDLLGYLRLVGALRQPVGFMDTKELLSQDVGP